MTKKSKKLRSYLIRQLSEQQGTDSDVLLTALFYVETWKFGQTTGPDKELTKLLKQELIEQTDIDDLKQSLIAFASRTKNKNLFQAAVSVLAVYEDKKLIPLFQGWLNTHVHELLDTYSALYQLMHSLDNCGEKVFSTNSRSLTEMDSNLSDSRDYLYKKLGIAIPW